MASKDKTPTGSNATGLLPDMLAYMAEALSRNGKVTETSETPAGYFATTWNFPVDDDPAGYDEVVYTSTPFPETPDEATARLEHLSEGVEAALEASPTASQVEGTAEPVTLPELTHYSSPLRDHLKAQSAYYDGEIARLARLTENAMKAQSAIHNALSSLDRDGL